MSSKPFRLQEDLVAVAIGKPHDLVFDGRAIARPGALDITRIHRRAVQIGPDQVVPRRRGPGDPALDLRRCDPVGEHRERHRIVVGCLLFNRGPVDGTAIQARGRAGLQASEREAESVQGRRHSQRRVLTHPTGRNLALADMDQPAQERPGREDNGGGPEFTAIGKDQTYDPSVRDKQIVGFALDNGEPGCGGQFRLHGAARRASGQPGSEGHGPRVPSAY